MPTNNDSLPIIIEVKAEREFDLYINPRYDIKLANYQVLAKDGIASLLANLAITTETINVERSQKIAIPKVSFTIKPQGERDTIESLDDLKQLARLALLPNHCSFVLKNLKVKSSLLNIYNFLDIYEELSQEQGVDKSVLYTDLVNIFLKLDLNTHDGVCKNDFLDPRRKNGLKDYFDADLNHYEGNDASENDASSTPIEFRVEERLKKLFSDLKKDYKTPRISYLIGDSQKTIETLAYLKVHCELALYNKDFKIASKVNPAILNIYNFIDIFAELSKKPGVNLKDLFHNLTDIFCQLDENTHGSGKDKTHINFLDTKYLHGFSKVSENVRKLPKEKCDSGKPGFKASRASIIEDLLDFEYQAIKKMCRQKDLEENRTGEHSLEKAIQKTLKANSVFTGSYEQIDEIYPETLKVTHEQRVNTQRTMLEFRRDKLGFKHNRYQLPKKSPSPEGFIERMVNKVTSLSTPEKAALGGGIGGAALVLFGVFLLYPPAAFFLLVATVPLAAGYVVKEFIDYKEECADVFKGKGNYPLTYKNIKIGPQSEVPQVTVSTKPFVEPNLESQNDSGSENSQAQQPSGEHTSRIVSMTFSKPQVTSIEVLANVVRNCFTANSQNQQFSAVLPFAESLLAKISQIKMGQVDDETKYRQILDLLIGFYEQQEPSETADKRALNKLTKALNDELDVENPENYREAFNKKFNLNQETQPNFGPELIFSN